MRDHMEEHQHTKNVSVAFLDSPAQLNEEAKWTTPVNAMWSRTTWLNPVNPQNSEKQ